MNLHTTIINEHSWKRISPEDKRSIEGLIRMGSWVKLECGCLDTGGRGRGTDARCLSTWDRLDNGEIDFNPPCQHPEVCCGHR